MNPTPRRASNFPGSITRAPLLPPGIGSARRANQSDKHPQSKEAPANVPGFAEIAAANDDSSSTSTSELKLKSGFSFFEEWSKTRSGTSTATTLEAAMVRSQAQVS